MFSKVLFLFAIVGARACLAVSAAPEYKVPQYGVAVPFRAQVSDVQVRSIDGPARLSSEENHKRDHHKRSFTDKKVFLKAHNNIRNEYNAGTVSWHPTLERYAQKWANNCKFQHPQGPYGENLWASAGSSDSSVTRKAVYDWASEAENYDPDHPGFSMDTGHFTQVVWADTKLIGCATAKCTPSQLNFSGAYGDEAELVVCEYWPRGNYIGRHNFEVNVKI